MTRLPQLGGFTEPHSANVLGKKRHDKIFAITADRHFLRKSTALFRKDSTTSTSDIFATHILTRAGRIHGAGEAPTAQSLLAEHGDCQADVARGYNPAMGFNKRKMEDDRRQEAETNRDAYATPLSARNSSSSSTYVSANLRELAASRRSRPAGSRIA